MQRGNNCLLDGETLDPFTDYEAAHLSRMIFGAEELTGMVPYQGGSVPFTLDDERGRHMLVWNDGTPGVQFMTYDESGSLVASAPPGAGVVETEVPVRMFYGGVAVDGPAVISDPLDYLGNVLDLLDPSDATDFETLRERERDDYYWAHDLSVRFTLDDNSVIYRLLKSTSDYYLQEPGAVEHFAINLPRDLGYRVTQAELIVRPFGARSDETELKDTDTADNFYDAAEVVAVWTPSP